MPYSLSLADLAAPEAILGEECTEKSDIYSMGVVLWEVVTQVMGPDHDGSLRFVGVACSPARAKKAVQACQHSCGTVQEPPQRGCLRDPEVPRECPPEVAHAIKACMQVDTRNALCGDLVVWPCP